MQRLSWAGTCPSRRLFHQRVHQRLKDGLRRLPPARTASRAKRGELIEEAKAAFQALVDALVEQQREGHVRADDPLMLARFVWSVTHGVAMLVIDGQLRESDESGTVLNRYAAERIRAAIAAPPSS